jgi:hypothetical protein
VVLLSPAEPREFEQDPRFLNLVRLVDTLQAAPRVGAVKHKVAHPLGMTDRIFDGDRAAPAGRDQGKSAEAGRFDHAFKITHPGFKRKIANTMI